MNAYTRLTSHDRGIEAAAEHIVRLCVGPLARDSTPVPGLSSFLSPEDAARYNILRLGLMIAEKAATEAQRPDIGELLWHLLDGENAARSYARSRDDGSLDEIEEAAAGASERLAAIIDTWGADPEDAGVALPEWHIIAILRRMPGRDASRLRAALHAARLTDQRIAPEVKAVLGGAAA